MSEAILNETLLSYVQRRNQINMQITQYQNSKTLASAETSDLAEWKTAKYSALRTQCKNIFSVSYKDSTYSYVDYTEIPEYTEEVTYIDCYYEAQVEDLTTWESQLENQITTLSTELAEINSYMDSYKTMLSDNIKNDYNYAEGL
ncbi:MAG: hypothetical protein LUB59_02920 [Candidatus Gastranaerophilales bacterium]|nr:hypothetical protein [Candidatus Gastranaerophilales bacterium]